MTARPASDQPAPRAPTTPTPGRPLPVDIVHQPDPARCVAALVKLLTYRGPSRDPAEHEGARPAEGRAPGRR